MYIYICIYMYTCIYVYLHMCVYIYIDVYINREISTCTYMYEGLRPVPPAPKLEDAMVGRFDDSMDG